MKLRPDRRGVRIRALALLLAAAGLASHPGAAEAAGSHSLLVNAVVLSRNICSFNTPSSTISLTIDPTSGSNAVASGAVVFRCVGSSPTASYGIANNNGLHGSSPTALLMRHSVAAEFMPYSLSYPSSGTTPRNTNTTITVTASVSVADFRNARAGSYADAVVLTIAP